MRVRFWGTRGSIAKAGPSTLRYGGNTSCVEVRSSAGTLIVLDCGTGAHGLGHALATTRTAPLRGHMLITHTHWDHIQGFPFFVPLFLRGDEWDVYAPRGIRESVRESLAGQMQYTYFPVGLEQFAATVRYHDLVEGAFSVDDVRVTTRYLNHPALALAYRLEVDGATLVYATDHEPHSRALAGGASVELAGEDRRHAEFLRGADLVIHDAQYTAAEYPAKVGWGHSTVESVVTVALAAGVGRLALYHHDPLRDDDAIDQIVAAAARQVAAGGGTFEVLAAAEGLTLDLARSGPAPGESRPVAQPAEARVPDDLLAQAVLIAVDGDSVRALLDEAVRADGLRPELASGPDEVLARLRVAPPSLLLLGRRVGGWDGLELCRALRKDRTGAMAELPVVLVAASEAEADRAAGDEAGVTDWLVAPFSPLYARTRIRAWALRQACRWLSAAAPPDEPARLAALRELEILDTPAEERFERITRLARRLFDVPVALLTLIDAERQWFKSHQGLDAAETPRDWAFCAHAIRDEQTFVVPDARLDPRFADHPMVAGEPRFRFYAGRPVHAGGFRVGSLCVIDHRPRDLRPEDVRALEDLAALVERELTAPAPPPTPPAR